jgi:hypothetical protein
MSKAPYTVYSPIEWEHLQDMINSACEAEDIFTLDELEESMEEENNEK